MYTYSYFPVYFALYNINKSVIVVNNNNIYISIKNN